MLIFLRNGSLPAPHTSQRFFARRRAASLTRSSAIESFVFGSKPRRRLMGFSENWWTPCMPVWNTLTVLLHDVFYTTIFAFHRHGLSRSARFPATMIVRRDFSRERTATRVLHALPSLSRRLRELWGARRQNSLTFFARCCNVPGWTKPRRHPQARDKYFVNNLSAREYTVHG